MARLTLDNIRSLPDIIPSDNFTLQFGTVPTHGDSRTLTLKCLDASFPGSLNEAFEVNLAGFIVGFRGRKNYTHRLQVQFVEDKTFDTYNTLSQWLEFVVGTNSATSGGDKSVYSVPATMNIYDQTGAQISTLTFYSMFPTDLQDVPVTGQNTNLMQITATFNFDYISTDGTTIR